MSRASATLGAFVLPLTAASRLESFELARRVIVLGCAAALILAGQALPL